MSQRFRLALLAWIASAPAAHGAQIAVTVDALTDRHAISPYIYGGACCGNTAQLTDSGITVVRWGGNTATTYNWQTHSSNSAADYYFEDYAYTTMGTNDSTQFVSQAAAAGGNPLMTMVLADWVSKATSNQSGQFHSFSVQKYGAQCRTDQWNGDAGNGVKTDCSTNITGNDPHDAYAPILDTATSPCPASAGNCTNFVNRQDWATALVAAFGSAPHFYDMDNEADIWNGTHRDIHPNPVGYEELRDVFLKQGRNVKSWDPAAIRLAPVSCCWWFYWNLGDKGAHGNIDFLPWWLNELYWRDQIDATRSLDVFDVHAYPGADTSNMTTAQKQAVAVSVYRDYWDPGYVSTSGEINQIHATSIQPNRTVPFRIPRMRAMANMIYPGTPLAFTEWSGGFLSESDFSTALGDADAYGIMGRERLYLASRWGAPDPANPNYQSLKLYRNYDGNHGTFGTTSVAAAHNASPDLFSVYSSLTSNGAAMEMIVINKDPSNTAQVTFALNHFSPTTYSTYTLSQSSPNSIVAGSSQSWSATQSFPPYTATLLVIAGTVPNAPAAEWELNPDTIQVPAGGSTTLAPRILSGSGTVTLGSAQFDAGSSCSQNGGSLNITTAQITAAAHGAIAVSAGNLSGFCHFTVTAQDSSGVSQTQSGWIVVGNPPATLTNNTAMSSRAPGTTVSLSVTLNPGYSVSSPACGTPPCGPGFAAGASVLFTVDGGALSAGAYPATAGSKQIATANGSGVASVQLTLPASGVVHVTAEGPYALGHPVLQFTETVLASSAPATPVLISPADGSNGVAQASMLSWQAASGATSYNVYFGTNSTPPLVGQTSSTSYNPGQLSLGTTYYWMVAAVNDAGSTNSTTWSFTTTSSSGGSSGPLYFIPVAPCRVVDTRFGGPPFGGPFLAANEARSFPIPQSTCGIPATAHAYSLNVTVVPKGYLGFLSLYPSGRSQPTVSTLNSWQAIVVANAAIVPAGANGAVTVFVPNPTDVILDINGYFDTSNGSNSYAFYPATPCRVVDTRSGSGQFGAPEMNANQTRDFPIPLGSCSIPATARGYAANVTVLPDGHLGFLSAYPTGLTQPGVSTLNSWTGKVVANAAIVPAGSNESISVYVTDPTQLILDVNGYFGQPGKAGALMFYPVTPCRVADTRQGTGQFGGPEMEAGTPRAFAIPESGCGVPSTAQAYSLNVTVAPDGYLGFLSEWPSGGTQPNVSTLNSWDGSVVANAAIVPAGTGGAVAIYVSDRTHVILDINGYFAP